MNYINDLSKIINYARLTWRKESQAVRAQLQEHNAKIKGVILNNWTYLVPKFIYDSV